MNQRVLVSLLVSAALLLMLQVPAAARPVPSPQTLVIGVDHVDPANQQPDQHRLFEYTDFFSREVTVHTGDILDFRAAPNSLHNIALAADEEAARAAYPVLLADTDDSHLAPGTGKPKIQLGPGSFSVTGGTTHGGGVIANNLYGPPVCGVEALGESPCIFSGGDDVEIAGPNPGVNLQTGQPAAVDWKIKINARPGKYDFFCTIHPGMRGELTVVGEDRPTTKQSEIDARSLGQFFSDRAQALNAERHADRVEFSGGKPGTRTYQVKVGVSAADNHVAIDEMFPRQPLDLKQGDKVEYVWPDPHNVHTLTFPTDSPSLPEPFGFDCGTSFISVPPVGPPPPACIEPGQSQTEFIGDPGNASPGTVLQSPTQIVDAGLLTGRDYHVKPSTQSWSLSTSAFTNTGAYNFQCTVHDWMQGTLNVRQ